MGHVAPERSKEERDKKMNEELKKLIEESGVDHEVLILEGAPAEAIIDAADVEKCDLIVMGTRGLTDFQGMALGSVSHKVIHSMDRMILLVP